MMLQVNNCNMDLSTVYGIIHFKFTCFWRNNTVLAFRLNWHTFQISHVHLGNLRYVNRKGTYQIFDNLIHKNKFKMNKGKIIHICK